jgi:hypothetical protein
MTLKLTKPTGKTSWPFLLLAGGPGAGKTYLSIQASASRLVDQTLVLTLGEEQPDEYSNIAGADFMKIEHDGTYDSILQAVLDVAALPQTRLPNLFVFDSATILWDLLVQTAQALANRRAVEAARASRRPVPVGDAEITSDLWKDARTSWYRVIDTIRGMNGPTIVTARLDEKVVMVDGVATSEKAYRIRAEPNLPYDASAVVECVRRGDPWMLTKIKSAAIMLNGPRAYRGFRVEDLWTELGLDTGTAGQREYSPAVVAVPDLTAQATRDWLGELADLTDLYKIAALGSQASAAKAPRSTIDAINAKLREGSQVAA